MGREILRIGIAGTGFIGRGLVATLERRDDMRVTAILTRRAASARDGLPRPDLLTDSPGRLLDRCDLLIECSGDVLHATDVVDAAVSAGKPVVTMNSEFQVTAGSYFVDRGLVTEAEGDQPGSLAALAEEAAAMGFRVVVYGNRKGYYHPTPPLEQMQFWASKQGLSLDQVTAATDGTKLQIEQALVANGLGATIARDGMLGVRCDTLEEAGRQLAAEAARIGGAIADYTLAPNTQAGIFVACEADPRQQPFLEYFKLGPGPFYVLVRNYHLCHLEIAKTVLRVRRGLPPLLNNSTRPTVSVAAVAKRALQPGERIIKGIGSFDVRGEAVRIAAHPRHVPIGLVTDALVKRRVDAGQELTFEDVELPESLALAAWKAIAGRTGDGGSAKPGDRSAGRG
jgi:predicted homoserine dehydrogenase-like protein